MSTTPSKVISHGTSSYEYRQVCCTASHLLFQTDNHHCGGKDTNSWKSSNTCSSLHSSPARLFSTEKLPLNYGSMNDRDVQSFPLTWNIQIESNFLEPNLTHLEIFELHSFKKLVVLISKQCLDEVMQNHLEEALALLKRRQVPFKMLDSIDPMQWTRYV